MVNYDEKRYKNIIGKNVEWYRLQNGYTQENLADIVGCKQQTINSIEKGRIKRSKYLPYIANALGINIADLDPDLKNNQGLQNLKPIDFGKTTENLINPLGLINIHDSTDHSKPNQNYIKKIDSDVPIFSTIKKIHHYFTLTSTPVEYIPRPYLVNLEKDAFGIIIGDQTMSPLFRIGDIIIIHPRKTVKEQDICLFTGCENGITIHTIGELIHENTSSWIVKQYEPDCTFSLPKTIWKKYNTIIIKIFR